MNQQRMVASTKKITVKATIQRLWDSEALDYYRESLSTNEEFMARHREEEATGKEMWVDCHDEMISWTSDSLIRIGRQPYAVGPIEDRYRLRCICVGCPMDQAYCQRNHQVRIADYTYEHLRRKVKAAQLTDGDIIRFKVPFTLSDGSECDMFRMEHLTHGVRRKGQTQRQTSTVFYAVSTGTLCRITNFQLLDWEIVPLAEAQLHGKQSTQQ
ncbi:MAG: hypothetical protein H0U76_22425 [Ktedonobacteraceae bacterium]|nr:hypothetical protein [Ktedonobacteraceae bacterium]